jgi:hypothetical protein
MNKQTTRGTTSSKEHCRVRNNNIEQGVARGTTRRVAVLSASNKEKQEE